ncbi:MAG: hypothetical protein DVS81_11555 [Candidatus Accumulibacter meliphilus]|uniref:Uncharacterized protein n=1 Tax=Candidatus Accumulibacter meliphilus TaxID=2211374 RepID=A0A369XK95_9PROT|nr:MAG: hypothetical protein DVS81_11555 [Candidatus Accumulibacter meliphilus]
MNIYRIRSILLATALVFGAVSTPAGAASGAAFGVASPVDPQGAKRESVGKGWQEVTIMDNQGFNQPMEVGTVRIPEDWVTRGGVTWDRNSQCVGNMMRMSWQATSRDGLQGFEIRPGYNWQVQGTEIQFNPCAPMPINSVRAYLGMVVNQRYAGRARILQYRDRPDLVEAMPKNPPGPGGARVHYEAGQMLIGYSQDGREFRESLITTISFSEMQGNVVAGTTNIYAQHAPDGQLDFALGERLRNSMRAKKQWVDRWGQTTREASDRIAREQSMGITKWHNDRMAQINLKGANDRSQIRQQTLSEVSQIYSNTWKSTQETDDRIQRRTLEGIGEYNTYKDPASNTPVRATIHNDYVWRVGDGRYISTDNPNYAPINGDQLERLP